MKQVTDLPVIPNTRKHYMRKVLSLPTTNSKPTIKPMFQPELSKLEKAVIQEAKYNIGAILSMGDGSLPFLIGILAARFPLIFTNEDGMIRNRLLKATLSHLKDLNLLKIVATSKFPLGPGRVSLTI